MFHLQVSQYKMSLKYSQYKRGVFAPFTLINDLFFVGTLFNHKIRSLYLWRCLWHKSWIFTDIRCGWSIWRAYHLGNWEVYLSVWGPKIQLTYRLAPECQYLVQTWFIKGMQILIQTIYIDVCGYYGMWFEYCFFFETFRTAVAATIEAGILLEENIWIGTQLTPAFTKHHC